MDKSEMKSKISATARCCFMFLCWFAAGVLFVPTIQHQSILGFFVMLLLGIGGTVLHPCFYFPEK
jgi:hypothetical protein